MATTFHSLTVLEVHRETPSCVSVALEIPADLQDDFAFTQGQYLTFEHEINGEKLRRCYSICSGVDDAELRVAIKEVPKGRFSTWANNSLKAGMKLECMAPQGRFFTELDPSNAKHYVAFAAGSGITPLLSHIKTVMARESQSRFTLMYTNKDQQNVIFREELADLKDRFLERLRVFHFFTQEPVDTPLYGGRMDEKKCDAVISKLLEASDIDEVFACGPEPMIHAVKASMERAGLASNRVHFELFTAPADKAETSEKAAQTASDGSASDSKVWVVIDGSTHAIDVSGNKSILDAGLDAGLDLPYSCCGGVCCTCRALVTEGTVKMDVNYALEDGEVKKGYVLACQSHPEGSEKVVIDFDQQ
jgi:ring-1,2-phenylacetyl-CoA epoxidase subunit PaaE